MTYTPPTAPAYPAARRPAARPVCKIACLTSEALPPGCPRPIEYRDKPLPDLDRPRIHSWVCTSAEASLVKAMLRGAAIRFKVWGLL